MTAFIKSTWDPSSGEETKIGFSEGRESLTRIAKLDHLKDTIADLEAAYNNELAFFNNGEIE